jgi:hypothetical protein
MNYGGLSKPSDGSLVASMWNCWWAARYPQPLQAASQFPQSVQRPQQQKFHLKSLAIALRPKPTRNRIPHLERGILPLLSDRFRSTAARMMDSAPAAITGESTHEIHCPAAATASWSPHRPHPLTHGPHSRDPTLTRQVKVQGNGCQERGGKTLEAWTPIRARSQQ